MSMPPSSWPMRFRGWRTVPASAAVVIFTTRTAPVSVFTSTSTSCTAWTSDSNDGPWPVTLSSGPARRVFFMPTCLVLAPAFFISS